ncbi:MAG: hypothetical protein ACM31C_20115 [Acidobacteriota bacterium]
MALRRSFACLLAALAVCAWTACKGKGDAAKTGDLDQRCEQLGKTCGDSDKHIDKIVEGCKQAAAGEKSCADKVAALYDCYEKELCGKGDKIWAVDDLRVLAERNNKCAAERKAVADCTGGK